MITNKDVEKLKETFATKNDLQEFKNEVNQKFDEVNQKFDEVNQKFDEVNQKFDETNRHFDVIAEDLKGSITFLAEQMSAKNSKVDEHEEKIETLETDVSVLKIRASSIEAKTGKNLL